MEAPTYRGRLVLLTGLVIVCFAGLGCRLVELQWVRHDEFVVLAGKFHEHSYFREATRGDIRDRRGNLLATSVPVKTVCADPSLLVGHEAEMAQFLAPFLKTNEQALADLMGRHSRTNAKGLILPNQYVRLAQRVPLEDWEKLRLALVTEYTNQVKALAIHAPAPAATAGAPTNSTAASPEADAPRDGGIKQALARLSRFLRSSRSGPRAPSVMARKTELMGVWLHSIVTEDDQVRIYPNGQMAAHVLGFLGSATIVTNGMTNSLAAGREGIEATFDPKLRGARGWVKTETDNKRRELYVFREQDVESRPGLNVVLTIDARIQQIVEEELAPVIPRHSAQSTFAIVMRPRTGEILAMASLPTFDPNQPGRSSDASRRNRVIGDAFEPGSTFKTVTLASALNDGTTRLTDQYDCENGIFYFADRRFPLHDHEHYRIMTVRDIIAKSSNIGTAKVAIRMGQAQAYKHIVDFGFGQKTGIPLTGEGSGYLPPLKYWKPIHISRIPIGQGVSATALQSTLALCAVANGGTLMRPMLVDRLVDEKGNTVMKYEPQPLRRVISEAAAKTTTDALKSVVEKGTAEKAALEHYTVAGKTGTAQKFGADGQYSHEKYFASFMGYFPADEPELCVAVFVDEPSKKGGFYGGQVAAPVFKRIAERAANFLNIKPDIQAPSVEEAAAQAGSALGAQVAAH